MWKKSEALERANDIYRSSRRRRRARFIKKNWRELTAAAVVGSMVVWLIAYFLMLIAEAL